MNSMQTTEKRIFPGGGGRKALLPAAFILLAVSLTYLNSFPGAFHYDDYALFLENPEIRQQALNPSSLLLLYAGRPLSLLSLELEYLLFGENPLGFHLVSVMLHLGVTLVLFVLVGRFSASPYTGFLAALIFALHPLQAQAVNYIWSRSVLLAALFLLSAILVSSGPGKTWPGLLLYQLAVWSRMDALAALPLMIFLHRGRKAPVLTIGILNLAAAGYSFFSADHADMAWNHPSPWKFILEAPLNLMRYLELIFHPGGHSVFHAYPDPGIIKISLSCCMAVIIISVAVKIRKAQPLLSAGTAWLILMLLPSLLIPNADPVNESRAYLAFAGAALAIGTVLIAAGRSAGEKLSGMRPGSGKTVAGRITAVALSLACIPLLAMMTMERNHVWNDGVRIWEEAVTMNPESHLPVYNLGVALVRRGEFEAGCEALLKAVALNPLDDMSYSASGYCYEILGDMARSREYYSRALELNPENRTARESLERLGRLE